MAPSGESAQIAPLLKDDFHLPCLMRDFKCLRWQVLAPSLPRKANRFLKPSSDNLGLHHVGTLESAPKLTAQRRNFIDMQSTPLAFVQKLLLVCCDKQIRDACV